MKLWGGRFKKDTNSLVEKFNASIDFDQRLYLEDIAGSMAHVTMLAEQGIIDSEESLQIKKGLNSILKDINEDRVNFTIADEDIHMNIERILHEKIGPLAGKLHTARSRNDQVALDMHLYLRKSTGALIELISILQESILEQAKKHSTVILPGYTHLQRAQPVLFSHHLMSYFWMLKRDADRYMAVFEQANVCPLGAGALAGTTFPINRKRVAEILGFSGVYENSMDAVSNRDYVIDFLSSSAVLSMHLSRLSEEFILWSSTEFNFIELDDAFTTGSSIMPQKKNPDVAELVRGKTGRIYGNLFGLLTTLKGLPLTYNKDMQEDKEGMFDTIDNLDMGLRLFSAMIDSMQINENFMRNAVENDFSTATDIADYLVVKGLPFRKAHEVVGQIVASCIEKSCFLHQLSLADYQGFSELIEDDIFSTIQPENVVARRKSYGGTGHSAVEIQIKEADLSQQTQKDWLDSRQALLSIDIERLSKL